MIKILAPQQPLLHRVVCASLLCLVLLFCSPCAPLLHAHPQTAVAAPLATPALAAPQPKRVLILNSYHSGMRFSDEEVRGIREHLPRETQFSLEYMDSKRVQGETYINLLANLFAKKFKNTRFDTILSLDDDALRFLLKFNKELFPDTPIVFCGVNALTPGMLDNTSHINGILEIIDPEAGIDFALRLMPQTKHIAVITDPTTTGTANRATLQQLSRSGRFNQQFIFLDPSGEGLELDQLLESIAHLPPHTILYHSDFFVDKFGNTINIEALIPQLSKSAPCPIFVHNDVYMGLGVLGGKVNSGYDQGAAAAELTKRIWAKKNSSPIPQVTEIRNRVMIDDQQSRRWNISKKSIVNAAGVPEEEIRFFNQPEDFWRGRGKYVSAGLGFIALEGLLIAWLFRLLLRQKTLQTEARQAVRRFRALFDLAPFACVVNDQDGRYLMVNRAFTLETGISAEMALGNTSQEAGVLMEKEAVRTIKQVLHDKGSISGLEITISLRPNRVLHVLQASTLIDWDGKPVILTATADITRIRQAELALRESEERYRELVQSAAVIILKCDAQGIITFVNDYSLEFFGYQADELLGKSLEETIVPSCDSHGQDLHPLVSAAYRETAPLFENINENKTKNGELVWVHWKNRVIHDQQGQITEIFSFGTDITKRKQAEEEREKLRGQLQQAQKLESVGRLAGGVAHDFNNMLGVIIGHTEMVLNALGPDHKLAHNLEQVLDAANRSADLTKQLLAFARKQPIAPKVLELNQTISVLLAMIRRLIGENIELVWQPGDALWAVRLDPTQVTQVLANLCINARDALGNHGKIIIATANITFDQDIAVLHPGSSPREYVQITFSDNGCGMDQLTQERAFEPFFTTKDIGQGTGLGLAMVSGIVSQNSGFINLYSEPGRGTTFRLHIPRYGGTKPQDRQNEDRIGSYRGQGTILLVEDEQALLDMTASMLEHLGYTVKAAANAEEALQIAQQTDNAIDLLITDVVMPGRNGKDLAHRLQQLQPKIRCLFISGYSANLVSHDKDPFLEKPFTRTTLGAKIQELLSAPRT